MANSTKIALVTTCKGRLDHLRLTLPKNIQDNGHGAIFVVLDYNDQEGLSDYISRYHARDIASGQLVYYRNTDAPKFRMAHAKNQAHRCAIRERADILITVDADNFTGGGFVDFVAHAFEFDKHLSFLSPDFDALPPRGHRFNAKNPLRLGRGFAGRLAVRAADFVKAGGYNETFETWRGEDIDLIARLDRIGFKKRPIDPVYLNAIAHGSSLRFKEYPEAKQFENDEIYGITALSHDTVVNHGRIGCGVVSRNFSDTSIPLDIVPTRVFGIGMQRTGTTSLHEAFQLLGLDSAHWESADWAQTVFREVKKWGRSRTLERRYAACDNPIPLLYKELDTAYPGSKFVLTVRDEDAWIRSVRTFWTYQGNRHRWTWDIDGFSHKVHAMTYGRVDFDEATFRERYRQHNAEVKAYFRNRPADLLVIDVQDGVPTDVMTELCAFLGVPDVGAKFPHSNKSIS